MHIESRHTNTWSTSYSRYKMQYEAVDNNVPSYKWNKKKIFFRTHFMYLLFKACAMCTHLFYTVELFGFYLFRDLLSFYRTSKNSPLCVVTAHNFLVFFFVSLKKWIIGTSYHIRTWIDWVLYKLTYGMNFYADYHVDRAFRNTSTQHFYVVVPNATNYHNCTIFKLCETFCSIEPKTIHCWENFWKLNLIKKIIFKENRKKHWQWNTFHNKWGFSRIVKKIDFIQTFR